MLCLIQPLKDKTLQLPFLWHEQKTKSELQETKNSEKQSLNYQIKCHNVLFGLISFQEPHHMDMKY